MIILKTMKGIIDLEKIYIRLLYMYNLFSKKSQTLSNYWYGNNANSGNLRFKILVFLYPRLE